MDNNLDAKYIGHLNNTFLTDYQIKSKNDFDKDSSVKEIYPSEKTKSLPKSNGLSFTNGSQEQSEEDKVEKSDSASRTSNNLPNKQAATNHNGIPKQCDKWIKIDKEHISSLKQPRSLENKRQGHDSYVNGNQIDQYIVNLLLSQKESEYQQRLSYIESFYQGKMKELQNTIVQLQKKAAFKEFIQNCFDTKEDDDLALLQLSIEQTLRYFDSKLLGKISDYFS